MELKVTVGAVQRGDGGGTAQGPWWLLGCWQPCCAFAPRPRLWIPPLWDLPRGMEVPDPSPATWEMMLLPSNGGHLCGAGILLWGWMGRGTGTPMLLRDSSGSWDQHNRCPVSVPSGLPRMCWAPEREGIELLLPLEPGCGPVRPCPVPPPIARRARAL